MQKKFWSPKDKSYSPEAPCFYKNSPAACKEHTTIMTVAFLLYNKQLNTYYQSAFILQDLPHKLYLNQTVLIGKYLYRETFKFYIL